MSADSRRMCKACFAHDGRWALALDDGPGGRQVCDNHGVLYAILDKWTEAHWDPRTEVLSPLQIDCVCGCIHPIVAGLTACHDDLLKTRLEWVEMWAVEMYDAAESGDHIEQMKVLITITDMAMQVRAYRRLLVDADS